MIKIQCSVLEQARKNPTMYGQLLASDNTLNKGGTHGMLAYWQDVSLNVHKEEIDLSKGIKELQRTFMNFEETPKNLRKQDFLQDSFVKYHKHFEKKRFKLVDTKRRIKWNIAPSGLLTGLTPWVLQDGGIYYSYFFTEQPFDWDTELKYPLIQKYLVENNIECDITEMNIGIYCLSTDDFSVKNFSKRELKNAVEETVDIFDKVDKEYAKQRRGIR